MTEKHPLTDKKCDDICLSKIQRRAGRCDSMRVAADWQLEEVIEWLHSNLNRGYILAGDCYIDTEDVISSLKDDLRPQQWEDN